MQSRYIVTGGAGLIGSNLVKGLNDRGETSILIVDHLNHDGKQQNLARLTYRDYLDKADFLRKITSGEIGPPDCLFHLGACSSTLEMNETYLFENNVRYTQHLCDWALSHGVRFIYASSAATYGDGAHGYSDRHDLIPSLLPLNPYGRSKQQFDLWALESNRLEQIVGLKYFNVYGPGEEHKGEMRSLILKACHQIVATGRMTLFRSHRSDYRDGEQLRDFLYVQDAVAMTLHFLDHPTLCGVYNVGTGVPRSWLDVAHALFAAMGREPKIDFVDIPEAIRDKYQYFTRAEMGKLAGSGFSFQPLSVEKGVSRYVAELIGN